MKAYQLTKWQQPPELRDVEVPEPGPGRGADQGRRRRRLSFGSSPDGVAGGADGFRPSLHPRARERRMGRGARRRSRRASSTASRLRSMGPGAAGAAGPAAPRQRTTASDRRRSAPSAVGSASTAAWPSTCWSRHGRLLLPLGDLDPRDAAPLSDAALTPYHAVKRSLGLACSRARRRWSSESAGSAIWRCRSSRHSARRR